MEYMLRHGDTVSAVGSASSQRIPPFLRLRRKTNNNKPIPNASKIFVFTSGNVLIAFDTVPTNLDYASVNQY